MNQWFYQCKYCGSEPNALGAQIKNCDNKPLKHLQKCNKAPQSACSAVRMQLAAKAIELVLVISMPVPLTRSGLIPDDVMVLPWYCPGCLFFFLTFQIILLGGVATHTLLAQTLSLLDPSPHCLLWIAIPGMHRLLLALLG